MTDQQFNVYVHTDMYYEMYRLFKPIAKVVNDLSEFRETEEKT